MKIYKVSDKRNRQTTILPESEAGFAAGRYISLTTGEQEAGARLYHIGPTHTHYVKLTEDEAVRFRDFLNQSEYLPKPDISKRLEDELSVYIRGLRNCNMYTSKGHAIVRDFISNIAMRQDLPT